jgi:hypothetical protein
MAKEIIYAAVPGIKLTHVTIKDRRDLQPLEGMCFDLVIGLQHADDFARSWLMSRVRSTTPA